MSCEPQTPRGEIVGLGIDAIHQDPSRALDNTLLNYFVQIRAENNPDYQALADYYKVNNPTLWELLTLKADALDGTHGDTIEFAEFIPLDTPTELPPIKPDMLPDLMAVVAAEIQTTRMTPFELPVMAMLAAASCACSRFCRVKNPSDGFTTGTNTWTVTAMASGNDKSYCHRTLCTGPLRDYEKSKEADTKRAYAEAAATLELKRMKLDVAKRQARKSDATPDDAATFKNLSREVTELEDAMPPAMFSLFIDDATPERLPAILAAHNSRAAWLDDEGEFFETVGGRYSEGRANTGALNKAYDGGQIKMERATGGGKSGTQARSIIVDDARVTIGLMPQPALLSGLMSNRKFKHSGFLARFNWLFPTPTVGTRDIRNRCQPNQGVVNRYIEALNSLLRLGDSGQIRTLKLSQAAGDLMLGWIAATEPRLKHGTGDLVTDLDGFGNKLGISAMAHAGVFHCFEQVAAGNLSPTDSEVSQENVQRAIDLIGVYEQHGFHAIALMSNTGKTGRAAELWDWLQSRPSPLEPVTRHKINRALHGRAWNESVSDLDEPLRVLAGNGYIATKKEGKSLVIHINPEAMSNQQAAA